MPGRNRIRKRPIKHDMIRRQQQRRLKQYPVSGQYHVRHDPNFSRSLCQSHQLQMIISEGLCFVDQDFCVESLSKEAQRILGLQETAIINRKLFEQIKIISHNFDERQLNEYFFRKQSQANEVFRDDDCLLYRADGNTMPIVVAFAPIYVGHEFHGGLLAMRDISQLKKIEESLIERTSAAEKQAAYRAVQLLRTEDELKHQAIKLAYQSTHDNLTGLYNRSYFETKLEKLIDNASKFDVEHMLLYMDLDQFKIINDSFGHLAGDEMLRQLAAIIKEKVRQWDIIARLGGDEFGIQLLYCTKQQAQRIADDIRDVVQQHRLIWNGKALSLTASIGLVSVTENNENVNDLMTKADNACYLAKNEGRDRIYLYRENDEELRHRFGEINCIAALTNALDENRLELFYQPIKPLHGDIEPGFHYEILTRILDEEGNYILPEKFLPAAERYNLISRIDRWVIHEACQLLERYPQHLQQLHCCAINISGQSLNDDRFLAYVEQILMETSVAAEKLCFEITETGAIANFANAVRFINHCKALGIKFSLDDFGSGLSSFAYLKNLPVNHLKIDGMFVKNMLHNDIDFAMVKSIHDLGKVMGKKTIAEFVEDHATLQQLQTIGVDYAQGFVIAKPQPFRPFLDNNE